MIEKEVDMLFGALLILGAIAGIVLSALSHPKIYRALFRRGGSSLDHREEC